MIAWEFLIKLHETCHFWSMEGRRQEASSSELKRWLINGAVMLNARKIRWDEEVDFPIMSLVLFQNSKHKTTIF